MRILLTNDDGIMAPGILAMRRALEGLGDVTIVAPMTAQSAVGHAISVADPVRCHRIDLGDGLVGHGVDGRPADCVKLAVLELMPERPDLVVSGLNLGANVGINVLYSGTVAAAIEGAFYGIPSVAASLEVSDTMDFAGAARIVRRLIDQFLAKDIGGPAPAASLGLLTESGPVAPADVTATEEGVWRQAMLLNVNVPDLSHGAPRGVRVVPQSMKGFREGWEKRQDPRGRTYYWMIGAQDVENGTQETDVSALARRYVTVTPLRFDLTDHERMAALRGWDLTT